MTPLYWKSRLFVSTPHGQVLALNPGDGTIQWRFDTDVDLSVLYVEGFTSRGVAVWSRRNGSGGVCADRVIVATVASELVALDAHSGRPCSRFGTEGRVRLDTGVEIPGTVVETWDYSTTSPPIVVGDLVVVGSSVRTNGGGGTASGVVRAYDADTGVLRWSFDPIPRSPDHKAWDFWTPETAVRTAGGNVWGVMSADEDLGLVYLPTSSAGPDSYGGLRPGRNDFANSIVAVDAASGSVVWSFQVVHHDLWDYDVAAQPVLVSMRRNGGDVPAVVVGTKSGSLFILDRRTGEPLIPVAELPVPTSDVPGERAWPTQPFPRWPTLQERYLSPDSVFGVTGVDRVACRTEMARLRNEGTFTPPSLEGTVVWPGFWGGVNWDGMAWDPSRRVLIVALKRLATVVELQPISAGIRPALGVPFNATRKPLVAPSGVPCTPPPWSLVIALDLDTETTLWTAPLGTVPSLTFLEAAAEWGSLAFGGPLVTEGGLVFIGASQDDHIRAFDIETGRVLWTAKLPAGGQATPMTYQHEGVQYVVIAAGGRAGIGSPGDWIVGYSLEPT